MQKFRVYVETSFVVRAKDKVAAAQLVSRKLDLVDRHGMSKTMDELLANVRSSNDWDVAKET
jgi:hypothetical protein